MTPARAGHAAVADLALLRDVAAQLRRVLVVDLVDLVLAEEAGLAPASRRRGARPLPIRAFLLLGQPRLLERDVVVRRGGGEVVAAARGRAGRDVLATAVRLAFAAPAEELD